MLYKPTLIERKQEKKRLLFALILSLIIHVIVLSLLFLIDNLQLKQDEVVIVKVQLLDKIEEEFDRKTKEEKAKIIKKIKKEKEKEKKKLLKEKKKIEKQITKKIEKEKKQQESIKETNQTKQNNETVEKKEIEKTQETKESHLTEKPIITEETTDIKEITKEDIVDTKKEPVEKKDLFKEYEELESNKDDSFEETFFSEKEHEETESDNLTTLLDEKLDKINDDLDFLDEKLSEDGEDSGTSGDGTDEEGITWEGSQKRKLIYSTPITIPDTFKQQGLKTSITLKFSVNKDGLIVGVDPAISTGFTELDEEIKRQFKRWKFEKINDDVKTKGTIVIDIGY